MTLVSQLTTKTVEVYETAGISFVYTNAVMDAKEYFPLVYKTNALETLFNISSYVWFVIFVALIILILLIYHYTKSEVKGSVREGGNIYSKEGISAAGVYGILKPKIVIPKDMPEDYKKYVMLHEKVHIKRRDNLLRCIAVFSTCLHWFNPLSWVFLKYFFEDMELACDAKVLKMLEQSEHRLYAEVLLNASAGNTFPISSFGGAKVKVRIKNILSYKKLTIASALCFSVLTVAVILILLTNAQI